MWHPEIIAHFVEELLWTAWLCLTLHSSCRGCEDTVELYKLILWPQEEATQSSLGESSVLDGRQKAAREEATCVGEDAWTWAVWTNSTYVLRTLHLTRLNFCTSMNNTNFAVFRKLTLQISSSFKYVLCFGLESPIALLSPPLPGCFGLLNFTTFHMVLQSSAACLATCRFRGLPHFGD